MPQGFDRGVIAGIVILAAMMVGIAVTSYLNTRELRDDADRAAHSREVIDAVGTVRADVRKLQAAQRAYIIVGIESWLDPYHEAAAALRGGAARLAELTAGDPDQRRRAEAAGREIESGIASLTEVAATRRDRGLEPVLALARERGIRSFVDPLLETLAAMDRAERERLAVREAAARDAYDRAVMYEVAAAVLGLVALGLFVWLLARSVRTRARYADRLAAQRELLDATLSSIGDGVIATDPAGNVTFLNAVAEQLTGWPLADARGLPLDRVFHIVNETTRAPVENPAVRALRDGVIVGLANHTILIASDGAERPIDDSAAPIRSRGGVGGAVLVFRDISDKKKAEAEREGLLREVETERARLADVFQHAPSFMAVLRGPDHVFERANDRYRQLVGGRDVVGRSVREALPEVVGQGFIDLLDQVFRTGEAFAGTNTRVLLRTGPDGPPEEHHLDFVYQALFSPDGSVTGVLAQGVDLTARVRAEATARRADERAAAILESINEGFVVLDPDWRFVYVNAAFERMNGVRRDDLLGRDHWETYPATVGTRLETEYRRALATGTTAEFENHYEPWDRWYAVKAYPAPGGGLCVQVRDVTDAKRAELAIRESEERYRTLFNSIDEGFCVIEVLFDGDRPADYRFVELNPAFEKHTGLADAIGRTMRELVPNHDVHWFETYGRVATTGQPVRFVNEAKAMNDRWFDVFAFRLGGADSRRVAVLFNDITGPKRAEVEREQLVGRLREQDRRKDEFLATLAHELRNPLAPVRNGIQILRLKTPRDPLLDRTLATMERQLGHLVHLVDDLMDVARVSSGKVVLRTERVDLRGVVDAALESARPAVEAAGHELAVHLPDGPLDVVGDRTRLAQVLANLLNNAAKYTPAGGRITLAAGRDGAEAALRVADTGVGIPADMLSKVFDMFTQVGSSLERSQGGLGIGLTLVRRLVELHGGRVEARSDGPDRGSEFVVRLPLAPEDATAQAPKDGADGVAEKKSLRVLVVDDNEDAAESLGMLLELNGHVVKTAHDGPEALATAAAFRPAVVLLDLGMPGMNGFEVAAEIRRTPELADVTLVALTGWGQDGDRRRTQEAGFDHHLTKPADPAELAKLLAAAGR